MRSEVERLVPGLEQILRDEETANFVVVGRGDDGRPIVGPL